MYSLLTSIDPKRGRSVGESTSTNLLRFGSDAIIASVALERENWSFEKSKCIPGGARDVNVTQRDVRWRIMRVTLCENTR